MRVRNPRIRYLGIESFIGRPKRKTKKPLAPVTKGRFAVYNSRVSYTIENGRLRIVGG